MWNDGKVFKKSSKLLLFGFILAFVSCNSEKKNVEKPAVKKSDKHIVEIITNHMDFQMPDSIYSGWTTFKYVNNSTESHFFLLDKYPLGKSIVDTEREIGPVFQKGMDLINEGKSEEGFKAFNDLPEWFYQVAFVGGSGLISPGNTSLTSVKLEPGYYIVECYVKMPNGRFHSTMGMAKELIVVSEESGMSAPTASQAITVSSNGIDFKDSISSGNQVFSVHFKDQMVYENFVGHDINLVRLGDVFEISELEAWMNWADPKGLVTPAPVGFTFLGGVNDMPEGSLGFFEVDMQPGKYVLISEVPNSISKNLYKPFVVIP